ncbi:MAG: bifunctional UDP-N-acetylglucosamine diphosphorylase/glucosamine-1-phosphate N-acetyltransferase GlmU [Gammaproteobacteria bacterium]|nr:bifunctional UDP-N-acetylglucosamine diphosphorylase/glucosamine-1-phosphate N-acetyltransferase GlmU [Gammaproteobacteria bacterium]
MQLRIVILAAGRGTRMRSSLPKVLQPLAGRPLLDHVIEVAEAMAPVATHVVYGFGGDQVKDAMAHRDIEWHEQAEQLGTGHAVAQAMPAFHANDVVLVLYGDVPLIELETLQQLVHLAGENALALLTVRLDNPYGYGRIVRDGRGQVQCIVEEKDTTPEERQITEVNTGVMACRAASLGKWISALDKNNSQGEYYLTDVVAHAVADEVPVHAFVTANVEETFGINDKKHLAEAESHYRKRIADRLLSEGVTLVDPTRIDVRGDLTCGQDVYIDANVTFIGDVKLGDGVQVGPNCVIRDTQIEDGTIIYPNCVIEEAHFGPRCLIGPFARVRPQSYFGSGVKLGNFVEIKKSAIAKGSKVNHLSYIGDTTMGQGVNVGAGTITCNYDGMNKHETTIKDDVFIGSGTQLVAPLTIGEGATIGAGSVITHDAPAESLTLERGKQFTVEHWKKPKKKAK